MKIEINGKKYASIIEALEEKDIVSIDKDRHGTFLIQESCDFYFSATLTKDQLKGLGNELIALSET